MIYGEYNLTLCCDQCYEKRGGPNPLNGIGRFHGPTAEKTRKKARDAGWKVLMTKERAICPECQK